MKRFAAFLASAILLTAAAAEMEVTGSRVNLRKSPSTQAAVVGSLKAGDKVRVKQVKDGWAELEAPAGFMSATYLKTASAAAPEAAKPGKPEKSGKSGKPENPGKKPADPAGAKPSKAAKPAPGQVFADIPVEPGSAREVTVAGDLLPVKGQAHICYVLCKTVNDKYAPQCFVYVPDSESAKFKPFAGKNVRLVGTWYRVPGWKTPVMKVTRLKEL